MIKFINTSAQDLFDELITDAGYIFQGTEALHGRIQRFKNKVTQLVQVFKKVVLLRNSNILILILITPFNGPISMRALPSYN